MPAAVRADTFGEQRLQRVVGRARPRSLPFRFAPSERFKVAGEKSMSLVHGRRFG
jgi:hypothetical protein